MVFASAAIKRFAAPRTERRFQKPYKRQAAVAEQDITRGYFFVTRKTRGGKEDIKNGPQRINQVIGPRLREIFLKPPSHPV